MKVTEFGEGCVGVGVGVCLKYGWVGEGVLDEWHSLNANTYYKHEFIVLNSFWPKSGLGELWKNTLQFYLTSEVESGGVN